MNLCPVCSEPAVSNCRCPRRDSTCKNQHSWHTCTIHKCTVIGKSDHSKPINICTCGKEKKR